jgi:predicted phosphodiesterase
MLPGTSEVSRRLVGNRQKYIYIHGNHDLVSAEAFCTTGEHFMGINGTSILFTHGDIFDTMNNRPVTLRNGLSGLAVICSAAEAGPFEICKKIDELMLGSGTEMSRSDFNSRAVLAARAMGIDTIVTGHSHAGGTLETGDTLLLNSGGCLEGRFQYISMNPVTLEHSYNPVW